MKFLDLIYRVPLLLLTPTEHRISILQPSLQPVLDLTRVYIKLLLQFP